MKRYKLKSWCPNWDFHATDSVNFRICTAMLHKRFDLPPDVFEIDIILSKTPDPDAYKVSKPGTLSNEIRIHTTMEYKYIYLYDSAMDVLKDFGLPCYVRVEY